MSVEIFCTRKDGAEMIVTRVGSSSPATKGSATPLTVGSSLTPRTVPLAWRKVAWSVTTVPLASAGLRVMSNTMVNWLLIGRLRLRTSSTPVPLGPPVLLVLLTSAPGGTETIASVPAAKAGGALSASITSSMRKLASA
jgi:hypothetical protein